MGWGWQSIQANHAVLIGLAIFLVIALYTKKPYLSYLWVSFFVFALPWSIYSSPWFSNNYKRELLSLICFMSPFCAAVTIFLKTTMREHALTKAFRAWIILFGLIALISMDSFYYISSDFVFNQSFKFNWVIYGTLIFVFLELWVSTEYRDIQKIILSLVVLLYIVAYNLSIYVHDIWTQDIVGFVILLLMSVHMIGLNHRKSFNALLCLAGLRVLAENHIIKWDEPIHKTTSSLTHPFLF